MKKFFMGSGGYRIFNLLGSVIPDTGTVTVPGVHEAAATLDPGTPVLLRNFKVTGGNTRYAAIASIVHGENPGEIRLGVCGYPAALTIDSDDKIGWVVTP